MTQPDIELYESLKLAVRLIDALIEERPMLAAKMVGSTTLGNHRADLNGVLLRRSAVIEPEGERGRDIAALERERWTLYVINKTMSDKLERIVTECGVIISPCNPAEEKLARITQIALGQLPPTEGSPA